MSGLRYVVGIDPGLSGAIALITENGEYADGIPMPSGGGRVLVPEIVGYLSPWVEMKAIEMVVIENVHAMPKQGVSSTFTFGRALGAVEGMVETLLLPHTHIAPHAWKSRLSLPKGNKDGPRQFAMRRWPSIDTWRFKAKGQAIADAACIALAWIERKS